MDCRADSSGYNGRYVEERNNMSRTTSVQLGLYSIWLQFFAALLVCACAIDVLAGDSAVCEHHGGASELSGCSCVTSYPDFGGCLCCREKLTGNWLGVRPSLADNGITFDADVVQIYQGVAHGGQRSASDYRREFPAIITEVCGHASP